MIETIIGIVWIAIIVGYIFVKILEVASKKREYRELVRQNHKRQRQYYNQQSKQYFTKNTTLDSDELAFINKYEKKEAISNAISSLDEAEVIEFIPNKK